MGPCAKIIGHTACKQTVPHGRIYGLTRESPGQVAEDLPRFAEHEALSMAIHWIDLAIIIAYLLGITGVGLWFSRHQRN